MQTTASSGVDARADGDPEAVDDAGTEGSAPGVGEAGSDPDAARACVGTHGSGLADEEAGAAATMPVRNGGKNVPTSEGVTSAASAAAREPVTVPVGCGTGEDDSGNAIGDGHANPNPEGKEGKENGGGGRVRVPADVASAPREPGESLKSYGHEGGQTNEAPVRIVWVVGG